MYEDFFKALNDMVKYPPTAPEVSSDESCGKCDALINEDGIRTLCDSCLEDLHIDFTDRMEEMLEGYNVAQLEALKSGKMYESLKFRIADRIDYMKRMRD